MKTVTIRTNNDESTEQLTALLRSLDFVESVEVYDDSDARRTINGGRAYGGVQKRSIESKKLGRGKS